MIVNFLVGWWINRICIMIDCFVVISGGDDMRVEFRCLGKYCLLHCKIAVKLCYGCVNVLSAIKCYCKWFRFG